MAKKTPETETKKSAEQASEAPSTTSTAPAPKAIIGSDRDQLRERLRVPVNQMTQIISGQIENHPEREGLAVALDQLLGRLNMIIDRIARK